MDRPASRYVISEVEDVLILTRYRKEPDGPLAILPDTVRYPLSAEIVNVLRILGSDLVADEEDVATDFVRLLSSLYLSNSNS